MVCNGAVRSNPELPSNNWYDISAIDHGYVCTEPGLMISDSAARINDNRKIPVMVINNTNKTFQLKRCCPITRVENINEQNVIPVNAFTQHVDERTSIQTVLTDRK